ncbi:MAG: helix-turn-helix domain-containing protein [Gammaproteobacteria bacterium]|nr:helix-turn-helix domain-containing protein [Gammaproteobacteria bacterium]
MSANIDLLNQIIALAKRKGLKQKDLAERAGLSPESISRAKKTGDMHLSSLVDLAMAVGLKLCLSPDRPVMDKINNGSLFK